MTRDFFWQNQLDKACNLIKKKNQKNGHFIPDFDWKYSDSYSDEISF